MRLACLIAARNLGDTVVMSTVFRRIVGRRFADAYLVWTRPELEFLFSGLPECEIITSSFPVGTSKNFGGTAVLRFVQAVRLIRRRRPDVTIDLTGDVRERLFARLLGAGKNLHIGWEHDHPYRQLIRNPLGNGHPLVMVPSRVAGVYAAYERFLNALAPGRTSDQFPDRPQRNRAPDSGGLRVGIHPYASQASKLWPEENWRQVVADLLAHGTRVVAFAAPTERPALCTLLGDLATRVELRTGSLPQFAQDISSVHVLVGLDSFAVHMAECRGVRTITINAGTPPDLWAPPAGRVLASSGGCVHYPCFNVAPCRGRPYENACVRAISPSAVLQGIEATKKELGIA